MQSRTRGTVKSGLDTGESGHCPNLTPDKGLTLLQLQDWDSKTEKCYIVFTKKIFMKTNIEILSLTVPNAVKPYIFVSYIGTVTSFPQVFTVPHCPSLSQLDIARDWLWSAQMCSVGGTKCKTGRCIIRRAKSHYNHGYRRDRRHAWHACNTLAYERTLCKARVNYARRKNPPKFLKVDSYENSQATLPKIIIPRTRMVLLGDSTHTDVTM